MEGSSIIALWFFCFFSRGILPMSVFAFIFFANFPIDGYEEIKSQAEAMNVKSDKD